MAIYQTGAYHVKASAVDKVKRAIVEFDQPLLERHPPGLDELQQHLDFVVDSKKRRLIPNPEHGEKQMSEEYGEE